MPTEPALFCTVVRVGKKRDEDREVEDRVRAWIRERMERRELGVTAAAEKLRMNQGNLTRILQGSRGVSAGVAKRVSDTFQIDPAQLLNEDPAQDYFREYVPRPARKERRAADKGGTRQ